MRRTLYFFTLLIGISSGTLSQIPTSFDSGTYEREIRSILEKFDKHGVNKVNVAWEFANYHNTMIKEYPDHASSLLEITSAVAKEYELNYVLEGNTIVSAQLPPATKPTQSSGADKSADETDTIRSIEIFKVLEQMPRFPGCEDMEGTHDQKFQCAQQKMLEYIYANLKYPEAAMSVGIEGRVVVQFVIEEEGTITNITCVRGLGYGMNEEAIRVVESMNHMPEKWTPGKQRGKPVRVQFTLPVAFKL